MATALITGASKGLGEEFAWQLATGHHDLVVVARDGDALSNLAHDIRGVAGVQVEVLAADLTKTADLDAVAARIADPDRPVSMVVNNAGFGVGQSVMETSWPQEKALLDVLVTAPLRLSQAAAQAMSGRGHGAIVNVSSIAAHLANTTYAAHKRWLLDFTRALSAQLDGTGVSATAVVPGLVRTHFHDDATLVHMREQFPEAAWLTPEHVVTAALAGVRRRAVVVTPSARYAVAGALAKAIPSSMTARMRSMRER